MVVVTVTADTPLQVNTDLRLYIVDNATNATNGENFEKRLKRVLSLNRDRSDSPSVRLKNKTRAHRQRTKSMPIDLENYLETQKQEKKTTHTGTDCSVESTNSTSVNNALFDQQEIFVDADSVVDYQLGRRAEPPQSSSTTGCKTSASSLARGNQLEGTHGMLWLPN